MALTAFLPQMNDWANALLTVIDEWKEDQMRKRERFWREHFGSRKEVSWAKFVESLQLETGALLPSQERNLRFIIGTFAAKNQQPDTLKSRQLFLFIELFGALTTCYNQLGRVCQWYQVSDSVMGLLPALNQCRARLRPATPQRVLKISLTAPFCCGCDGEFVWSG